MRVYLAGPIFGCTDAEASGWRNKARDLLRDCQIIDPMDRDYRGRESANFDRIVEEDKAAILNADVVLAHCTKPSWGTAMEIMFAHAHDIPVVAIANRETASPWILAHAMITTPRLELARHHIRNLSAVSVRRSSA